MAENKNISWGAGITTWKEGRKKEKKRSRKSLLSHKSSLSLFFIFKIFHTLVSFSAYYASINIDRLVQLPAHEVSLFGQLVKFLTQEFVYFSYVTP